MTPRPFPPSTLIHRDARAYIRELEARIAAYERAETDGGAIGDMATGAMMLARGALRVVLPAVRFT